MRWSQLYTPTLRDDPADTDAVSHRLLLRAGYMRQLAAGHYSLLPLAVRVRARVVQIIREEMAGIGAQEMLLPVMHPAEVWETSGRWEAMGDEMFRLTDRKEGRYVLGMTHEEIIATLARELRSYRDLPQMWYQFQTKFRDEPRPKSGLMRVREFTMKDSYSLDLDEASLDRSFTLHKGAYERIFERLGIPALAVEASSGTMGGSTSVEFMCPSSAGEDLVASCRDCGYAANIERATSQVAPVDDGAAGAGAPEEFATPEVATIDDLARQHGVAADRQIKTLVFLIDRELTLVLLRGDHGLVEQKLIDHTGATEARPATGEEIRAALGASAGSLGAVGVTGWRVLADSALQGRRDMTTGANRDGYHLRGVDVARDIAGPEWTDLREVTAGEPCPRCGTALEIVPAIEIGHIFKLGRKYTDAFDVEVQGQDSAPVRPIMGCYGIGVERAMAAVIETHHDEAGIVWPRAVAPFDVVVTLLDPGDEHAAKTADSLVGELGAAGAEVLLDDRDERPGVKFRDAELVGLPVRVTVGRRGLESGTLEVTTRSTGETANVAVDGAAAAALAVLES